MIRYNCRKCGTLLESPDSLIGKEDTCPICNTASVVPQPKSRGRRAGLLWISAATVAVLVAAVLTVVLWPDKEQSRGASGDQRSSGDEPASLWPFRARIPAGFECIGEKNWRGRTLWILKGKKLDNATETVLVIRSTLENFGHDTLGASVWAGETCLGTPLGTSPLSRRDMDEISFHLMIRIGSEHEQRLVSPTLNNKKIKTSEYAFPDTSWPAIPRAELGQSADSNSGKIALCSTQVTGTLLVVGWAGNPGTKFAPIVEKLCNSLKSEPGEQYTPPPHDTPPPPFASTVPSGYKFQKVTKRSDKTLWQFSAKTIGGVTETLLVTRWRKQDLGPIPLPAITECGKWAAELALDRLLDTSDWSQWGGAWTLVSKNTDGTFKLTKVFGHADEKPKTGEIKMRVNSADMWALGPKTDSPPALVVGPAGASNSGQSESLSVVVRAFGLGGHSEYMIFAGAATSSRFWPITRAVDKFASSWAKETRAKSTSR